MMATLRELGAALQGLTPQDLRALADALETTTQPEGGEPEEVQPAPPVEGDAAPSAPPDAPTPEPEPTSPTEPSATAAPPEPSPIEEAQPDLTKTGDTETAAMLAARQATTTTQGEATKSASDADDDDDDDWPAPGGSIRTVESVTVARLLTRLNLEATPNQSRTVRDWLGEEGFTI